MRRVKCDERKPVCKRCVRFGVQCDGYAKPVVKAKVHTGPRPLVPKNIAQINSLRVQPYTGPDFSGEDEARYFRFYCENVAAQLSGPLDTSLWERIIPQAVETEPIIKHAVVAMAALNKSRMDAEKGVGKPNPHHQFALLQYGKALKKIRDALTEGVQDPRRSLMACLLVFCLESLQGYQSSASNQASRGVALLQRWCLESRGKLTHFKKIEEDICKSWERNFCVSQTIPCMLLLTALLRSRSIKPRPPSSPLSGYSRRTSTPRIASRRCRSDGMEAMHTGQFERLLPVLAAHDETLLPFHCRCPLRADDSGVHERCRLYGIRSMQQHLERDYRYFERRPTQSENGTRCMHRKRSYVGAGCNSSYRRGVKFEERFEQVYDRSHVENTGGDDIDCAWDGVLPG